ncbi:soluble lytic murein transglycosylase [Rhodobacter aestuarii]|uniref:Soluble lytic murein transglycosylase n=1 Tax=Rhodobacter aestuarii TaxID=453582 RepID=A0A1N7KEK4_9RHOB|nr:lytic transglycosylase domain-containing protein [Rhodobacter aestuarii]PTV95735.1 soluble lytic murein transglycosylase [Rhodobacter aestuarii]SIS59904.1 soluble lytic murein transglycosylase [Rhodobacter aestuarii]
MTFQRAVAALVAAFLSLSPPVAVADVPEALARALDAAQAQDWPRAAAEARASGPLAFDIIEWQRLRAGAGRFADYADFTTRRAAWPGMPLLHEKGEATLEGVPPAQVISYFATMAPQTGTGALALVAAHLAQGNSAKAASVAEAAWRSLDLNPQEQADFLARYPELVAPHHGGRMQMLLEAGKLDQARAMLDLVSPGTRAVAAARIALQAREAGVDDLVAAVPERMSGSYGLALDRAWWRWRNDLEVPAADLMLEFSTDADKLGDPALWADLRSRLTRFFLRAGDARLAYKLAARHRLPQGGGDWAELEWLAGYAALKLGDAPTALTHFETVEAGVSSPISQSRADYWRGRALEALGRTGDAQRAYAEGARHQTAYYGLLCAERAGVPLDARFAAAPPLPDWRGESFTGSPVFQAALLLHQAGDTALAERFILHLEESLPTAQIAPLAKLAEEWGNPHLMLSLGKRAAYAGQVLVRAYHPVPELHPEKLEVREELALSIARRESEFDPVVVSYVGARGMMQLMPGTAKMMAEREGVPYELSRLTSDPSYNVQLGAAYLAVLEEEFGASPVLVASGYNAGPGRPRRWIEERGDPRNPSVDVVDWVEMIPFDETRTYVMRVAESLPIYRARLGRPDAGVLRFTDELRGR